MFAGEGYSWSSLPQQPMGWTCCGQELNFSSVGHQRGLWGAGMHVAFFWRLGLCNRICKHHLCFFFFPLEVCCHAIFAICDVQLGKSNRNSGLKLDVSKPFKMWGGVQAVPVNGSLWSAIESCCPAITDTLFIGSLQTGLVNCILELITYYIC